MSTYSHCSYPSVSPQDTEPIKAFISKTCGPGMFSLEMFKDNREKEALFTKIDSSTDLSLLDVASKFRARYCPQKLEIDGK